MGSGYIILLTYTKSWNLLYKNSDQVQVVSLSIAEAALLTFCGIVLVLPVVVLGLTNRTTLNSGTVIISGVRGYRKDRLGPDG